MNETQSLAQKLLTVQRKIGPVFKSSINPHFKSRFADLNEVLDVVKPPLNEAGVLIAQAPGKDSVGQFVETSLIDASSTQQISGKVYFSGTEDNMQKIGAAITYARRFGLVSLLSLESEDDDGETAVGRHQATATKPQVASNQTKDAPRDVPSFNRKTTLEKIGLTAKVLLDSKRAVQEELVNWISKYNAKTKEELSDAQAKEFLVLLEGKLK